MNQVKKIGLLFVVSGLLAGFAQAAAPADATIRFSGGSVAVGGADLTVGVGRVDLRIKK